MDTMSFGLCSCSQPGDSTKVADCGDGRGEVAGQVVATAVAAASSAGDAAKVQRAQARAETRNTAVEAMVGVLQGLIDGLPQSLRWSGSTSVSSRTTILTSSNGVSQTTGRKKSCMRSSGRAL